MAISESDIQRDITREVARIRREIPETHSPLSNRGRKCAVCSDPDVRRRVNTLLGIGMGASEIVRSLEDINAKRKKTEQVRVWSIYRHRDNHFNLQDPKKAALLRVLENEYAREHADAVAEGVEDFLTARAYLKIVARKGFENLVAEDTAVGFVTGLEAQLKLEEMEKDDRDLAERLALRRDVGLIQQAIRDTLTEEQMRALSHRLDVLRGKASDDEDEEDEVIEGEIVDDDDDEYPEAVADFTMDNDEDDELGD